MSKTWCELEQAALSALLEAHLQNEENSLQLLGGQALLLAVPSQKVHSFFIFRSSWFCHMQKSLSPVQVQPANFGLLILTWMIL